MRSAQRVQAFAWLTTMALPVMLAGCGGGSGAALPPSEGQATSATRLQKMAVVNPPPPPACVPSIPVLANIDFGDAGWTGGDAPGNPVAVGALVSASVSFTDDVADLHQSQWTWGDGLPGSAGSITESNGAGVANANHVYQASGVFMVAASVSDGCSSAVASRQVVVYDPSAGFVTGGGWIDSPAGAYAADPTLAGRANFGFVSKYLKGASVPSGETEFQFQTAKLNFHSESYDWLVVAGARAQYKGTGSVNGMSGFKFLLTAVDGNLIGDAKRGDRFRIKIWHADVNSQDIVDYDNQVDQTLQGGTSEGTAIGGGSIVIHK